MIRIRQKEERYAYIAGIQIVLFDTWRLTEAVGDEVGDEVGAAVVGTGVGAAVVGAEVGAAVGGAEGTGVGGVVGCNSSKKIQIKR